MDNRAPDSDSGSHGPRAPDRAAPSKRGVSWAAELVVAGFGAHIGVRVSDASIVPRLIESLPPGTEVECAGPVDATISAVIAAPSSVGLPAYHVLFDGDEPHRRSTSTEHLLDDFDSLLRFTLAKFARDVVLVHAGVVGWKGKAIVIPGNSYSGKTSLTRALIEAGASYFSDEHAVLDLEGYVHPWFKPLSVRKAGQRRQSDVAPQSLGARIATAPCPVRLIVATHYKRSARWRPRVLTPSEGALELMSHTIAAQSVPALAMQAVSAAAARARTIKTARPDAARAARHIIAMLETVT